LTFSITSYTLDDFQHVLQFISRQQRTQYHLDWQPANIWLRNPNQHTLLAYQQDQLMGVMALSAPNNGIVWIRLVSLSDSAPVEVFHSLADYARQELSSAGYRQIGLLEMHQWLYHTLTESSFRPLDDIVHLYRDAIPLQKSFIPLDIHPVTQHDLKLIEAIDHAAFHPMWQIRLEELEIALESSRDFSMVLHRGRPIAYQISTEYADSLHLTRLATLPDYQGQGIATRLVKTLIQEYPYRYMTVNTQASNVASRLVYERLGFRLKRMLTPVWHLPLEAAKVSMADLPFIQPGT
jgi:ribosomal protein S18 acetylase RimI-like enzyme